MKRCTPAWVRRRPVPWPPFWPAGRRVYSGGEDCRILAWDLEAATAAAAATAATAASSATDAAVAAAAAGGAGDGGRGGDGDDGRPGGGGDDGEEVAAGVSGAGEGGEGGVKGRVQGQRQPGGRPRALAAEVRHPRKVNQLCVTGVGGVEVVVVAAVSKFVTLYRWQGGGAEGG